MRRDAIPFDVVHQRGALEEDEPSNSISSDETLVESAFGVVEQRELVAARQLRRLRFCPVAAPQRRPRRTASSSSTSCR